MNSNDEIYLVIAAIFASAIILSIIILFVDWGY